MPQVEETVTHYVVHAREDEGMTMGTGMVKVDAVKKGRMNASHLKYAKLRMNYNSVDVVYL
jgi:hypothetical protein